jgi:hypothetical protein
MLVLTSVRDIIPEKFKSPPIITYTYNKHTETRDKVSYIVGKCPIPCPNGVFEAKFSLIFLRIPILMMEEYLNSGHDHFLSQYTIHNSLYILPFHLQTDSVVI